jgi:gas vesicle protein
MANRNNNAGAELLGIFAGAVIGAAVAASIEDDLLLDLRLERRVWTAMRAHDRAVKLRSHARNVLKTIRETPSSLSNQQSQADKLVRLCRAAHREDRSVVGFTAVSRCEDLSRRLRWETGYLPVNVGAIDIS